MKQYLKHENLPFFTLIAGGLGLALRYCVLSNVTGKGFIVRGQVWAILLYVLTTVFLAALIFSARSLQQAHKYRFNFPASTIGAVGTLAAAACFGITSIAELSVGGDTLNTIAALLGILSAAVLMFIAHCRWKGLHPSTLFHIIVCAYLTLRLICMYRQWSSDPQLQDYCFQLLALVCLMLSAYHRACFDANIGKRYLYVIFNLAAVYFSCLSIAGPGSMVFFLGSAFWQITDLCNLTPLPKAYWEKKHDPA